MKRIELVLVDWMKENRIDGSVSSYTIFQQREGSHFLDLREFSTGSLASSPSGVRNIEAMI